MKIVTLKKNYEFQYVFKRGERFSSKHFTLIVAPAKKQTRFGFVISKKIGKAVVRNKKRRQLKEIIRTLDKTIATKQYIILAKPEIVECAFAQLKSELINIFEKKNFLLEKDK